MRQCNKCNDKKLFEQGDKSSAKNNYYGASLWDGSLNSL